MLRWIKLELLQWILLPYEVESFDDAKNKSICQHSSAFTANSGFQLPSNIAQCRVLLTV